MIISEALRASLRELSAHKFRSVLSFAAVSVGIGSILYTFAQTHGMRQATQRAIDLMGPGRMTIQAKQGYASRGLSPGLTWEDAREVRRLVPGLHMLYPRARRWSATLHARGRRIEDVPVQGVTPDWRLRDWVYTVRGRFLNEDDVRSAARVCVVMEPGGWYQKPFWAMFWDIKPIDDFLARNDLLGSDVLIQEHLFRVVGVLKQPARDLDPRWFHWEREAVLVPITTFHRTLRESGDSKSPDAVEEIQVDTGDARTIASAKRRIEAILRYRHRGEEDFEIQDNREMIENELQESRKYILAGAVLGMVALLAGGIGILNVTLATIFSRIKEIGIRRALGATRLDIAAQFVTEAALLGTAGSAAGVGLGLCGVRWLARKGEQDLASLEWQHFALVVSIGVLVSCLFSLYPAWQAAKLDPVTALRDE